MNIVIFIQIGTSWLKEYNYIDLLASCLALWYLSRLVRHDVYIGLLPGNIYLAHN